MERTLVAVNTAPDAENRMHGDEARRFGFAGGLVPGVDVLGYLAHEGAERWGAEWLGNGRFTGRLASPVYDGESVSVLAELLADDHLRTRVHGPDGALRAEATMAMIPLGYGSEGDPGRETIAEWTTAGQVQTARNTAAAEPIDPADRPPASRDALRPGTPTAAMRSGFHADDAAPYLRQISEDHPLFCEQGFAQPAWLLALANFTLAATVRLGPWIHVSSDLWMLCPVRYGDEIEVRGVVTDCFERRGHEFVDLRVGYHRGGAPVALVDHRAIWSPRPVGTESAQPESAQPESAGPAPHGTEPPEQSPPEESADG